MRLLIIPIAAYAAFQLWQDAKYDWSKGRAAISYVAGCVMMGIGQATIISFISALYFAHENIWTTIALVTTLGLCIALNKLVSKELSKRWHKIVLLLTSVVSMAAGFASMYVQMGA